MSLIHECHFIDEAEVQAAVAGRCISDSVKRHLSRRHLSDLSFLFNFIFDGGCTCEKEIRFR